MYSSHARLAIMPAAVQVLTGVNPEDAKNQWKGGAFVYQMRDGSHLVYGFEYKKPSRSAGSGPDGVEASFEQEDNFEQVLRAACIHAEELDLVLTKLARPADKAGLDDQGDRQPTTASPRKARPDVERPQHDGQPAGRRQLCEEPMTAIMWCPSIPGRRDAASRRRGRQHGDALKLALENENARHVQGALASHRLGTFRTSARCPARHRFSHARFPHPR